MGLDDQSADENAPWELGEQTPAPVCAREQARVELANSCPYLSQECTHIGLSYCNPRARFQDCSWYKLRRADDIRDGTADSSG